MDAAARTEQVQKGRPGAQLRDADLDIAGAGGPLIRALPISFCCGTAAVNSSNTTAKGLQRRRPRRAHTRLGGACCESSRSWWFGSWHGVTNRYLMGVRESSLRAIDPRSANVHASRGEGPLQPALQVAQGWAGVRRDNTVGSA